MQITESILFHKLLFLLLQKSLVEHYVWKMLIKGHLSPTDKRPLKIHIVLDCIHQGANFTLQKTSFYKHEDVYCFFKSVAGIQAGGDWERFHSEAGKEPV